VCHSLRVKPPKRIHGVTALLAFRVVALAICLMLSWLAMKIGMAAIIGAFFAGLVFADYAPQRNLLPRIGAIAEFLAPFFFFTIGTRLNISLFNRELVFTAMIVSILAVISKWVGCGLPHVSHNWYQAFQVGGMIPRGEVALIVAPVGLQTGIVRMSTYGIVVLMTATTTPLAPPLLRYVFRREIRKRMRESAPAMVRL
jgi:Kef-type K+ transport system membrane component KefB